MNITEVRVKMVSDGTERLRAFCSVTLDDAFVIRDLKVIDGADGPFVAMPSRKLSDRCSKCGNKNHLRARFCNECGGKLNENRAPRDAQGRVKLHADVAHPINAECREQIQAAVIEAFTEEVERVGLPDDQPDDQSPYSDQLDDQTPYDDRPDDQPQSSDEKKEESSDGFDVGLDGDDSDETMDYNQLIAELKVSVKNKSDSSRRESRDRGGRSSDFTEVEPDSEQPEAMESEPEAQPEPERFEAPPSEPTPVESPTSNPDEDGFGAGIL
ncbi:MAG: septation protein SpoVG family protein [Phycisphaerae bacterium]